MALQQETKTSSKDAVKKRTGELAEYVGLCGQVSIKTKGLAKKSQWKLWDTIRKPSFCIIESAEGLYNK